MQVRRVVQSFKTNYIKKGMSNYEKAFIAFNYLNQNCKYATRGWQYNGANTAWGDWYMVKHSALDMQEG